MSDWSLESEGVSEVSDCCPEIGQVTGIRDWKAKGLLEQVTAVWRME